MQRRNGGGTEVLPWIPSIAEVTTPLAIVSYTSCVVDLVLNKLSAKIEIACTRTVSAARQHRGQSKRAVAQGSNTLPKCRLTSRSPPIEQMVFFLIFQAFSASPAFSRAFRGRTRTGHMATGQMGCSTPSPGGSAIETAGAAHLPPGSSVSPPPHPPFLRPVSTSFKV